MTSVDPPLVVHVGLHKTGTTWLQDVVLAPMHGAQIELFRRFPATHKTFILPRPQDFDPMAARQDFEPLLAAARAHGRPAIITDEALGGFPFHHKFYQEVVAERIAKALPEAHILITIREQKSIIYSAYSEYIRYGYSSNIDQFLKRPEENTSIEGILDWEYYNYARLAALYQDLFGADRVTVTPFEWMVAEPAAALARLSARIGAPLEIVDAGLGRQVARPAWSDLANYVTRQLNRFHSQDARWQRRGRRNRGLLHPNSVGFQVDRLTPRTLRESMKRRMRARIARAVGGYYHKSNLAASRRIGVDLGALGYD